MQLLCVCTLYNPPPIPVLTDAILSLRNCIVYNISFNQQSLPTALQPFFSL